MHHAESYISRLSFESASSLTLDIFSPPFVRHTDVRLDRSCVMSKRACFIHRERWLIRGSSNCEDPAERSNYFCPPPPLPEERESAEKKKILSGHRDQDRAVDVVLKLRALRRIYVEVSSIEHIKSG